MAATGGAAPTPEAHDRRVTGRMPVGAAGRGSCHAVATTRPTRSAGVGRTERMPRSACHRAHARRSQEHGGHARWGRRSGGMPVGAATTPSPRSAGVGTTGRMPVGAHATGPASHHAAQHRAAGDGRSRAVFGAGRIRSAFPLGSHVASPAPELHRWAAVVNVRPASEPHLLRTPATAIALRLCLRADHSTRSAAVLSCHSASPAREHCDA